MCACVWGTRFYFVPSIKGTGAENDFEVLSSVIRPLHLVFFFTATPTTYVLIFTVKVLR